MRMNVKMNEQEVDDVAFLTGKSKYSQFIPFLEKYKKYLEKYHHVAPCFLKKPK